MEPDDSLYLILVKYTKALSVALSFRDIFTQLHSERVLGLSEAIGVACGLPTDELVILRISASFHDIGKLGVPDHILLKPGRHTDAEWKIMKQHSEMGEQIMAATELEGSNLASQVIRHHHEHYCGDGYPDGLSENEIPLCSRIIAIADSYDAMSMPRAYHVAKTHAEIMTVLKDESGVKHDPEIMRIFSNIIDSSKFKAPRV